MATAPWRCYVSWPPGHRWQVVTEDKQSFLRCARCEKRKGGTFRPGDPTTHHFGSGGE